MSDTIPFAAPDPSRKGDAGVSDSARSCPACGETFAGPTHAGCRGDDRTTRESQLTPAPGQTPSGSRKTIDDLPEEATTYAQEETRQLNQYILVKQIGKGGMGTVWKAWDRRLTRWVAIKFLLAEEDRGVDRFTREAKIAARLRHPNIAAIHEVGEAPSKEPGRSKTHFLVMEFIEGQTLAATKLPRRKLLEMFVKVARAIDVAHKGGVVHRDLKPLNIMVTSDQWPFVMDFGLARSFDSDSSLSQPGDIMGTPAYMSPEQAEGRLSDIDARSDIFSLGSTFYAALLGGPPFSGLNSLEIIRNVVSKPVPPPREIQPDFPPEVEAILLKALAKDKTQRYATAGEMAQDLEAYLEGSRPPLDSRKAAPPPAVPPPPAPAAAPRRRGLAIGIGLLIAAGGVVLAPKFLPEPPHPPVKAKTPEPATLAAQVPTPIAPVEAPPKKETFSLKVAVHPFAEVVRITCDGTPVPLENRFSPLLEPGLKIGSYEILLRHPSMGEKSVTVSGSALKPGKTFVVWGRMDGAALQVTESP